MSTVYLYIKQHSITKLKYFGKTMKPDPLKYQGSGTHWRRHINKHGKEHVVTLKVWEFDDIEQCSEFALKFSEKHDIVNSKEWANLMPENGKDGLPANFNGHISPERRKLLSEKWLTNNPNNLPGARERISAYMSGENNPAKRPDVREKLKGTKGRALPHNHYTGWSDETKQKISKSLTGKKRSAESILKQKNTRQGIAWVNNGESKPIQIKLELLDEYLKNGYVRGRGPRKHW